MAVTGVQAFIAQAILFGIFFMLFNHEANQDLIGAGVGIFFWTSLGLMINIGWTWPLKSDDFFYAGVLITSATLSSIFLW